MSHRTSPRFCISHLEGPDEGPLLVGLGSIAVVRGWVATDPGQSISGYRLRLGDRVEHHPPSRELRTAANVQTAGLVTEGFWFTVPLRAEDAGTTLRLSVDVELQDGSLASVGTRVVTLVARGPQWTLPTAPLVICLCTYNPDPLLFRAQIESLRAQTVTDWICLVEDDCSGPELLADLERVCGADPRFIVTRNERNVGFYRNFERCMSRVPASAQFVALCDQDDRWYPDKLAACLAELGDPDVQLVYSDMHIVDRDGKVLAETYWTSRKNAYESFETLLVANTVTGAASVMRRSLLDGALPFPQNTGSAFHDHWLACAAMAAGRIAYVDRPLYGYTQHGTSVIGHCGFAAVSLGEAVRSHLRIVAEMVARPQTVDARLSEMLKVHHEEYRKLALYRDTLLLRYPHMAPARRAALELFSSHYADALRLMVTEHLAMHRRGDTTNMAEFKLGASLALHRLIEPAWVMRAHVLARGRQGLASGKRLLQRVKDALASPSDAEAAVQRMEHKLAPLHTVLDRAQPIRVNLLVPEINFDHFFGGYIGKLQLAQRLAQRGLTVRMILVDPCPLELDEWRAQLSRYAGLERFFDHVEVVSAWPRKPLPFHPADRVVATTWWTAHLAHGLTRALEHEQFLYLIQEHEPFTFAMGAWYAMAAASYDLPHRALFSTSLLADYFRRERIGVFAHAEGEAQQVAFHNAIMPQAPQWPRIASRTKRRLLFYCRPEAHAARNMYEVGISALRRAVELGAFDEGEWELNGIGSAQSGWIELPRGRRLRMVERLDLTEYGRFLGEHDVGMSLMYTPHPSLVPLEMAAAGMLVVTNTCLNKTAASLQLISENLLPCEPTIEAVAVQIVEATREASDLDRRRKGSVVKWPTSWDEALSPSIVSVLEDWLRGQPAVATLRNASRYASP